MKFILMRLAFPINKKEDKQTLNSIIQQKFKNADKISGRKHQNSMLKDRTTTCQTYPCLTRITYILQFSKIGA